MRKQVSNTARRLCRQSREDVLQVGMWVVTVQLRRLHQTHHRRSALPTAQRAGEQPVRPAQRYRPDAVLEMVVVYRQVAVVGEPDEGIPSLQAVIDGTRKRRAVRRPLAV